MTMTTEEIKQVIDEERRRSHRDGIFISQMKQPWDSALAGYFHCLDQLEKLFTKAA